MKCPWCYFTESGRVADLRISAHSSNSLLVRWRHPTHSNGLIDIYLMRYRLTAVGDCPSLDPPGRWSRLVDVDSNQLHAIINDLLPYSHYQLKVWARTSAGRGQVAVGYGTTAAQGLSVLSVYVCQSICLYVLLSVYFFFCLYVCSALCLSVCHWSSQLH